MNPIKIGQFIASLRKELKLTQLELGQKIGVTDRAVSKWENGRGLPDISLIEPLCQALNISINELLCGERIEIENITKKAEENIIDTLNYSQKKINKTKRIFYTVLVLILALIVMIGFAFAIDVNRMRENKPVIFSTWGFDYMPPIDIKDEKIELAIKQYLTNKGDREAKQNDEIKTFTAIKIYLIEADKNDNEYAVSAWALSQQYYLENNDIMNYSSYSIPFKFKVVEQDDGIFKVAEEKYPRDGYYSEDMKELFDKSVIDDMEKIYKDGSLEKLQLEINEQISLYFHN